MRRSTGVLLAVLTALGFLVSIGPLAAPAAACSCVGTTDAEALARADVAFVATLADRTADEASGSATLTFAVTSVAKGDVAPRQAVFTSGLGGACGLEVYSTGPQLVFAKVSKTKPARLVGSLCEGTRALTAAEVSSGVAAAELLGTPALSPAPSAPAPVDDPKGLNAPVVLLSFTTLAAVVGFLMIARRHRRRMREQPRNRPSG